MPRLRNFVKKILGKGARGPQAVERSLVAGLKELGEDFLVNKTFGQNAERVLVLSGVKSLAWAIEQKKLGKIKTLIAGPNLVQTPNDHGGIVAQAEVDAVLVPSEQVKIAYERYNPKLQGRILVWYTGVNPEFWKPDTKPDFQKILLYIKKAPEEKLVEVEDAVKSLGFKTIKIHYGNYTALEYKAGLSQCFLSIFLSPSESQGVALAEAWSMDVPTLVWNPKQQHPHFSDLTDSPAPFLTKDAGEFWQNITELKSLLANMPSFKPRQWVIKNMTDKVSAGILLKILESIRK